MNIGILFVSTGDVCRAPMAAGAFGSMAQSRKVGTQFRIESAGVTEMHVGREPSLLAIEAAARRGYRIADFQARVTSADDIATFDYVLAMDGPNLVALRCMAPRGLTDKPKLLLKFAAPGVASDIPDPYGGTPQEHDRALDLIEAGCTGLLQYIVGSVPLAA